MTDCWQFILTRKRKILEYFTFLRDDTARKHIQTTYAEFFWVISRKGKIFFRDVNCMEDCILLDRLRIDMILPGDM